MKRFLKSFRHGERGFTLIELLIVVGILGVLVAVAIPNIQNFMKAGTIGAANAEAQMVFTAVDSCMAEAGVMELDTAGVDWNGDTGTEPSVTVGGVLYGAGDYLTLKGGAMKGTYDVDVDGTVAGDTYTGLEWDPDTNKWVEAAA